MAEILHPGHPPVGPHAVSENLPTLLAPSDPGEAPFGSIPVPDHVSTGLWQESWYDPTSDATVSNYVKLPSGPCSLETGQLTGEGFQHGRTDAHGGFTQV